MPYRGSAPGPRWGTSIAIPSVFFYVPPIILWDRRPCCCASLVLLWCAAVCVNWFNADRPDDIHISTRHQHHRHSSAIVSSVHLSGTSRSRFLLQSTNCLLYRYCCCHWCTRQMCRYWPLALVWPGHLATNCRPTPIVVRL